MGDALANGLEIGIGAVYAVGAVFNTVWTLGHSDEFFGSFADRAWLAFSRRLVQAIVLPRAKVFTYLLIGYLTFASVFILSRGALVVPGLIGGAIFCLGAALVSSPGGAIANTIIGILQLALAAAH